MARAGLSAEALVDAAATLADREGLDAVTIARLAADAGVRAPSLYAHVGGLDDLRRRLANRGRRDLAVALREAATEALATAGDAVDVLVAVLAGYGLSGDDAIHAARAVRSALHGFALLETGGGFGIKLDLDESFDRLVALLDQGLRQRARTFAHSSQRGRPSR
jgi:AcrR family transcriptional regulator